MNNNEVIKVVADAIVESPNARGEYVESLQVTPHMPYEDALCFAKAALSALANLEQLPTSALEAAMIILGSKGTHDQPSCYIENQKELTEMVVKVFLKQLASEE